MKKLTVLICFVLACSFTACEDSWGDDARMAYVIEIEEGTDGMCNYHMAWEVDSKTTERTIPLPCGGHKVGEGFFIDQE